MKGVLVDAAALGRLGRSTQGFILHRGSMLGVTPDELPHLREWIAEYRNTRGPDDY